MTDYTQFQAFLNAALGALRPSATTAGDVDAIQSTLSPEESRALLDHVDGFNMAIHDADTTEAKLRAEISNLKDAASSAAVVLYNLHERLRCEYVPDTHITSEIALVRKWLCKAVGATTTED